jgi:hypothetical protein
MAEHESKDRHLEDEASQAARTPLARHEDALSPGLVIREHSGADGAEGASQRVGNTGATGPTVSFPGAVEEDETLGPREGPGA